MNHGQSNISAISLPGRWFYLIAVFFLTLSGFGQMPIFKRYYICLLYTSDAADDEYNV